MRTRSEIASFIQQHRLIAVIRLPGPEQIVPVTEALLAGGIKAIEVTMTTPGALEAIAEISAKFKPAALVGVGTVLTSEVCAQAIEAGAEFVVTPVCRPAIATEAHARDRVAMIGAYTPTEAQTAYEGGADFIKIFPADGLGPNYMKALLAPLPHLKIVPTGGVELANVKSFLQAGCVAVGIGSSLVSKEILKSNNWAELTRVAKAFVDQAAGK